MARLEAAFAHLPGRAASFAAPPVLQLTQTGGNLRVVSRFLNLPTELGITILQFCNFPSIMAVARTSQRARQFAGQRLGLLPLHDPAIQQDIAHTMNRLANEFTFALARENIRERMESCARYCAAQERMRPNHNQLWASWARRPIDLPAEMRSAELFLLMLQQVEDTILILNMFWAMLPPALRPQYQSSAALVGRLLTNLAAMLRQLLIRLQAVLT